MLNALNIEVRSTTRKRDSLYIGHINKSDSFINFYKYIGYNIGRKQKRLEDIIQYIKNQESTLFK